MNQAPIFGDPRWIEVVRAARRRRKVPGMKYSYEPWSSYRGPGPDGATCKTCRFLLNNGKNHHNYFKCGKSKVTNGPGSDIRLRDRACFLYEPYPPPATE